MLGPSGPRDPRKGPWHAPLPGARRLLRRNDRALAPERSSILSLRRIAEAEQGTDRARYLIVFKACRTSLRAISVAHRHLPFGGGVSPNRPASPCAETGARQFALNLVFLAASSTPCSRTMIAGACHECAPGPTSERARAWPARDRTSSPALAIASARASWRTASESPWWRPPRLPDGLLPKPRRRPGG